MWTLKLMTMIRHYVSRRLAVCMRMLFICIICIDGHCFWIGYYKIIEMLIENGALVNFRDNHGISPLYQASLYGQFIFEYFFMCAFFYKWLNSQMAIYSNENIWLLYCGNIFFFGLKKKHAIRLSKSRWKIDWKWSNC